MADRSPQADRAGQWQRQADRRSPTAQRMRVSHSNSFYGPHREGTDFPYHYTVSIIQYVDTHGVLAADDEWVTLCVPVLYSGMWSMRWFELSGADLRAMRSEIQKRTPEAREQHAEEVRTRGDVSFDVNAGGDSKNCGYCVLARLLSAKSADEVSRDMEEKDYGGGMANDGLSIWHIQKVLQWYGRTVGMMAEGLTREELRHWIQRTTQDDQGYDFVVWFPAHFVLAWVLNDGTILVEDPQTHDIFEFDVLSDATFMTFAVKR
ncbi:hypothetical protein [Roseateles terrae]|uniref:Peptidase C39-like domain-containing protein n=1 Tax=Roseateles terrae TaxID=431060 RepID=A0ABR6GXC9_9BURK|nr:hypothetical protein [Roseateles terrae]MBB3196757.1 hypothetical protein [Roseateles terrae]OWQ84992.1 hypothetical protein CDN98_18285 [Roseateles terrae]